MVDLDDRSNCPTGAACATCGGTGELGVVTGQTPTGVFCCTLCAGCAEQGRLPVLSWERSVGWSLAHCGHLGIDADRMEALLLEERLRDERNS